MRSHPQLSLTDFDQTRLDFLSHIYPFGVDFVTTDLKTLRSVATNVFYKVHFPFLKNTQGVNINKNTYIFGLINKKAE